MIALQLGRSWQHEPHTQLVRDGVRLEIDGLNIIPRADSEDLQQVMVQWVRAIQALERGAPFVQVSLEAAQLEVVLQQLGDGLQLTLIEGRGLKYSMICRCRLDTHELTDAVMSTARELESSLTRRRVGAEGLRRALVPPPAPVRGPSGSQGGVLILVASEGLRLTLYDEVGLLQAFGEAPEVTHALLLVPGQFIDHSGAVSEGLPLLHVFNALRVRGDRATRALTQRLCTALFGALPSLVTHPILRQAFELSLPPRVPGQAGAPAVSADLASIESVPSTLPLTPLGTPAKLRFKTRQTVELPLALAWHQLQRVPGGHVAVSSLGAALISSRARHARVLPANHGAAVNPQGAVVLAHTDEFFHFNANSLSALWRRTDLLGLVLSMPFSGPEAWVLHTNRGLSALLHATGREQWHWHTSQRLRQVVALGPLIAVASEHETTLVDTQLGLERWRLPSGASLLRSLGKSLLTVSSGPESSLFEVRALTDGALSRHWLVDGHCIDALAQKKQVWALVFANQQTRLIGFDARGKPHLERLIPFAGRSARFTPVKSGALVTDVNGSAVRLNADGSVRWLLGALDDVLNRPISSVEARKTAVISGTSIRIVDADKGTLLATLEPRPHLVDLAVDNALSISVLTPGRFERFKPAGALTVIS